MSKLKSFGNAKPVLRLLVNLAILIAPLGLWGCIFGFVPQKEINPTLLIVQPSHGAVVHQSAKLKLKIQTSNFKFANGQPKIAAGQSAAVDAVVDVFLDRSSDLMTDTIAVMAMGDSITLDTLLALGPHYIITAGSTPQNPDVEGMTDTTHFTVVTP